MGYLLFPGRHLVNTVFQEGYLRQVLRDRGGAMPLDTVVFAVTSSNQQNSRYNPIEFHVRAIGVDRFAQRLGVKYRIVGVPHFGPTPRFARHTLREIEEQTEGELSLRPENTAVLCSTPDVIRQYEEMGYAILPAELGEKTPPATPIQIIKRVAELGEKWTEDEWIGGNLHPATRSLWVDFPQVPARITRLYRDPLLNDSGSITSERNYAVYSFAMSNAAAIELKYRDIVDAIRPGKIVDEGCADAGLLVPIARDFPDSDLVGIEITGEFMAQCRERQRRGDFGGTYTHFHQRNLMEDIFQPASIDTTICNSTVHELWSYGKQAETVRAYLRRKFAQTRRGGRIVVRDVVAPEEMDRQVYVWLDDTDGANENTMADLHGADLHKHLDSLSTAARFGRFARDFLREMRASGSRSPDTAVRYREEIFAGRRYHLVSLKHAAEFLTKKDYTDSWNSEMNEEFTYWSFSQWKTELAQAGFHVMARSRAYANPWIVEKRFIGKAELYVRQDDRLIKQDYPVTNLVIVGEKK